jgi:hypothetical protein
VYESTIISLVIGFGPVIGARIQKKFVDIESTAIYIIGRKIERRD